MIVNDYLLNIYCVIYELENIIMWYINGIYNELYIMGYIMGCNGKINVGKTMP